MRIVAFIPARSGSKRIPQKNVKPLAGHPLLAYSVQAAIDAGIFDGIYCSSDSKEILNIAEYYGSNRILCPLEIAHKDNDPDVLWIANAIRRTPCDAFAIIRPTNPFRTGETIRRAFSEWGKWFNMKAVERVNQHPGKMWIVRDNKTMVSYMGTRDHLGPTQALQTLYVQNASLELRIREAFDGRFSEWQPFFTEGFEGFDLNDPIDWIIAECLIEKGLATLPKIGKEPYETSL